MARMKLVNRPPHYKEQVTPSVVSQLGMLNEYEEALAQPETQAVCLGPPVDQVGRVNCRLPPVVRQLVKLKENEEALAQQETPAILLGTTFARRRKHTTTRQSQRDGWI